VRDWMLWKECPRAQGSRGLGFRRSHNLRLTVGRREWRSAEVGGPDIANYLDHGPTRIKLRRMWLQGKTARVCN